MPAYTYTDNGYKSCADYLRCMSDEYGVPINTVMVLADLLSENEGFDGLVTSMADYGEGQHDCGVSIAQESKSEWRIKLVRDQAGRCRLHVQRRM